MAKPLYQLLTGENAKKKTNEVEWTEQCEQAFNKLKDICSDTPILAYADYSKCFKVQTDASEQGLGAVLYVMYARVWGRPRATKHTKNASYRGGRAAN